MNRDEITRMAREASMKFDVRWEPRWPCFAVGFYRERKKNKYQKFCLIIWAIVFELTWGQA